mgnify:CR=1 FL=1
MNFSFSNSILTGYLNSDQDDKPLIGANIYIVELNTGAATDLDGFFQISNIPTGFYTIQISYISYNTKIIDNYEIIKGQNDLGNIYLTISAVQGQSINVVGDKKNDETSRILEQKLSNAVLSSVSSAEIRKSGDSNAAEAIRRITGVSITNEKNVVVRGLGSRYTETQINGFNLASPEPDEKVVPLNLFPSSLIEKILVYKTYISSLPANFAGGNVSVQTLSYPNKRILSFGISSLSNNQFSSDQFKLGNYNNYNVFGLNNKLSELDNIIPSNQSLDRFGYLQITSDNWIEIFDEDMPTSSSDRAMLWNDYLGTRGTQFSQGFKPKKTVGLDPNTKFTFNFGNKYELSQLIEFGFFSSLNISNKFSFDEKEKTKWSQTDLGFQESSYILQQESSHIVQSALVLSSGLKYGFNKQFALDWQTLLTGYLNNSFSMGDGYDSNVDNGGYFFDENLTQKQIASHRLSSNFKLNDIYNVSFQFNHSKSNLNRPDSKKHYYLRTTVYEDLIDCNNEYLVLNDENYEIGQICDGDNNWVDWMGNGVWDEGENFSDDNEDGNWGILDSLYTPYRHNGVNTGIRSFTYGGENVNSLKLDNNLNFVYNSSKVKLDFGLSYENRNRNFIKRDFYLDAMNSSFWEDYESFNPDSIAFGSLFDSGNYYGEINNGLILVENVAGLARNAYSAENSNVAAYLMSKINFNDISNLVFGLRLENDYLFLEPYNPTNGRVFVNNLTQEPIRVDRSEFDVVPSINYSYGDENKYRIALSKTKARPQFRELAPFEFQEYYSEEPMVGYPYLKSTDITNFDFRFEKYLSSSEMFSSAIFYKNFINPIEVAYIPSNDRAYKTYQNALDANSYGLELEYRKNLRFIPLELGLASIGVNGIFTKSSVESDSIAYLFNNSQIKNNASNLKRSMQGQSDVIFNVLINFKHIPTNITYNLSYNTFSKRINVIGTGDLVDEYEFPFHLVNFQMKKTFVKKYDFVFKIKNILNSTKSYGYLDSNTNEIFYTKKYSPGISFSASFKVNF